jgi:hypothetical protein
MQQLLNDPPHYSARYLRHRFSRAMVDAGECSRLDRQSRLTTCSIALLIAKFADGSSSWTIPSQFDNFTAMAEHFRSYKQEHFVYITTLFVCAYLYKQTFAIPGSFFLVCRRCSTS